MLATVPAIAAAGRWGPARTPPRSRSSRSCPWLASTHLLQDPGVAVGVAEVGKRAVVAAFRIRACLPPTWPHVANLADVHPALDELGARRLDVEHDQVGTSVGARCRARDPDPDADRARR